MEMEQYKDVEQGGPNCLEELEKPLIVVEEERIVKDDQEEESNGSVWMLLLSTAVAVCGSFEFGSCVGYSAPTQSQITGDLNLTTAEYSMFGSILTIGAMIGAITSGRIADFIGRKGAMRTSAVSCIAGWLAIFYSTGVLTLDMGRFLTGYGIGIFSYVVPIFIAEIAPKNLRGGLTTLNQLMIIIGSSTAFLLGTVISWRALALTGLVPCVFLLAGLFFVPESPRWLAKVGKKKEFQAELQKLRSKYTDITREAVEIQVCIETLESLPKARIIELLDAKYIRSVFIGVTLMAFQQFGGINGIAFYVSETFKSAGFSSGNIGTIAFAFVQVPITVIGAMLMDKSGRRLLLMVSASGTFLGCFLAGLSFFFKGEGLLLDFVPMLAVSGVLVYISAFSVGMGAVPWVIMSEIFPINIKGLGGSLVALVSWLGAWIVSFTFNFLMGWSPSGTFFIYAGFSLMTIVFTAIFVPETKGKTLEEIQIQACINHRTSQAKVLLV